MKKILLVFLLLVLLIAGGIIGYYSLVSTKHVTTSEKNQALEKLLGHAVRTEKKVPKGDLTHTGKYVSFSYPASYTQYQYNTIAQGAGSDLENFLFQNKDTHTFVATEVLDASSAQTLNDISGVLARRNNKQTYTEEAMIIDKQSGTAFLNTTDGVEKTGYVIYHGRVYSFSVTGDSLKIVTNLFGNIIASVKLY